MGRVGLALIGLAILALVLGGGWLASGVLAGQVGLPGAILGAGLLIVVLVGPLGAGGWLILRKGRDAEKDQAESENLRKILDVVTTRGAVKVSDLIFDLHSDLPSVQNMIYRLVGMGVFNGYVNWDDGVLYSAEAAGLRNMTECKKCGGKLTLAGKGVIKCPFCGTEYFVA